MKERTSEWVRGNKREREQATCWWQFQYERPTQKQNSNQTHPHLRKANKLIFGGVFLRIIYCALLQDFFSFSRFRPEHQSRLWVWNPKRRVCQCLNGTTNWNRCQRVRWFASPYAAGRGSYSHQPSPESLIIFFLSHHHTHQSTLLGKSKHNILLFGWIIVFISVCVLLESHRSEWLTFVSSNSTAQ